MVIEVYREDILSFIRENRFEKGLLYVDEPCCKRVGVKKIWKSLESRDVRYDNFDQFEVVEKEGKKVLKINYNKRRKREVISGPGFLFIC